jgi:hypothetical protein
MIISAILGMSRKEVDSLRLEGLHERGLEEFKVNNFPQSTVRFRADLLELPPLRTPGARDASSLRATLG